MRVRWTTDAASDLEQICDYIARDRLGTAHRVADDITKAVRGLSTFPNRGRLGRVEDTRELVLAPLPFIAVYELQEEQIVVLRILHGAQRWPQR
jgi:toxin ParE1/3/4